MIRFSFSFQHETPVSWQTEVDERLLKLHVERWESGSVRELFRPSRQVMSSSMAKERKKLKSKSEEVTKTRFFFMAELPRVLILWLRVRVFFLEREGRVTVRRGK